MFAPLHRQHIGVRTVVIKEHQSGVSQSKLTLAWLLKDKVDTVLFPFQKCYFFGNTEIPYRGVDKRFQSDSHTSVDRCTVFIQSLQHVDCIHGLPRRLESLKKRAAGSKQLFKSLTPRQVALSERLRIRKVRRISGKANTRKRPADGITNRLTTDSIAFNDHLAEIRKLDQ